MSNNYKPNDKFVRTSKETSNGCRKEHILRWKWIENDGKGRNYSEINRPNSGYRELMTRDDYGGNTTSIDQDLNYDIRRGWIRRV
jgi:hypothetical protein